jgi:hypothetical protein
MAIKSIISRALGLRNVSHDFYIARSLTRPEWLYQFGTTIPKAPIAMTPVNEPSEEDVTLCHRLIAAYTKAASGDLMTDGPIWSSMIRREYGSLRATVDSRDASALAELLCRMFRSSCVHGIASGDLYRANLAKRFWQLKLLDDCVSLAEYLGAVRVENPEQGRIGVALADGVSPLIDRIEERLRGSIGFPCVGAPYGIYAGDRLLTMESPEYTYVAARIREAVRSHLPRLENPEMLEIGAGFGGTALYVMRLMPEIRTYTIVDLPVINVLQGYFLGKCFGADAVSLFGEQYSRIRILPTSAIEHHSCNVLINENSMPEMSPETVHGYLRWAVRGVHGIFYSYQQEAWNDQVLVHKAVAESGAFLRLSRNRSWVRRGYVEETYANVGYPALGEALAEVDERT